MIFRIFILAFILIGCIQKTRNDRYIGEIELGTSVSDLKENLTHLKSLDIVDEGTYFLLDSIPIYMVYSKEGNDKVSGVRVFSSEIKYLNVEMVGLSVDSLKHLFPNGKFMNDFDDGLKVLYFPSIELFDDKTGNEIGIYVSIQTINRNQPELKLPKDSIKLLGNEKVVYFDVHYKD